MMARELDLPPTRPLSFFRTSACCGVEDTIRARSAALLMACLIILDLVWPPLPFILPAVCARGEKIAKRVHIRDDPAFFWGACTVQYAASVTGARVQLVELLGGPSVVIAGPARWRHS